MASQLSLGPAETKLAAMMVGAALMAGLAAAFAGKSTLVVAAAAAAGVFAGSVTYNTLS